MNEKKSMVEFGRGLRGYIAISEATAFMRTAWFTPYSGSHADGEYASVDVSIRRNLESKTMSVLILSCGLAPYDISWKDIPILVCSTAEPSAAVRGAYLDGHGRAIIPALPDGSYRLLASETWAHIPLPEALGEFSALPYETDDGRVDIGVTRNTRGAYCITATARDPDLAGSSVLYTLVEERFSREKFNAKQKRDLRRYEIGKIIESKHLSLERSEKYYPKLPYAEMANRTGKGVRLRAADSRHCFSLIVCVLPRSTKL